MEPTERIRIAYVVDNISFRGGERTFLQLVSGLPRSRYEVAVACSPGGYLVERLHDLGVPVIPAEMRRRRRLDTVLHLRREFRRRRPHIVHTQGRGDPFGRLAGRLARVPVIVSTTAMIATRYEVSELWRRVMYRYIDLAVDRVVDRFIVVNRISVEPLVDRHRVSRERIKVIPNGIEIERYDPGRTERGRWRTKLGVPEGARLLGGLGRLTPQKGFSDLIKAFASLDRSDTWLVIAGDGPQWDELHGLIQAFGVEDRCSLAGFVDDVPGFLADLDVFVLSSYSEGHPMVLLEAMAMARPVVATDVAGVGDTLSDGVDGRLVPVGDVAALAAALTMILRDGEAARAFGRRARAKVQREYTVERMVRRTEALYEEVLAEKGLLV